MPVPGLAGTVWAGADNGNIPALMEKLYNVARKSDSKDVLVSYLVGVGRALDVSDEDMRDVLFNTYDGPVFYYP